jgi:hypothetical protein
MKKEVFSQDGANENVGAPVVTYRLHPHLPIAGGHIASKSMDNIHLRIKCHTKQEILIAEALPTLSNLSDMCPTPPFHINLRRISMGPQSHSLVYLLE